MISSYVFNRPTGIWGVSCIGWAVRYSRWPLFEWKEEQALWRSFQGWKKLNWKQHLKFNFTPLNSFLLCIINQTSKGHLYIFSSGHIYKIYLYISSSGQQCHILATIPRRLGIVQVLIHWYDSQYMSLRNQFHFCADKILARAGNCLIWSSICQNINLSIDMYQL